LGVAELLRVLTRPGDMVDQLVEAAAVQHRDIGRYVASRSASTIVPPYDLGRQAVGVAVPESDLPDSVRTRILQDQQDEFSRYARVIGDSGNPLTGLHVITNSASAGSYFGGL
jgi:hypothetical protein